MALITLTSDYGLTDPYLASVKGALYSQCPEATLCNISHQIEPGNFFEASFVLRNSYEDFPEKTVHLLLVTELVPHNRWLVVELHGQYFVAADNGILSLINPERKFDQVVQIDLSCEATLFPGRTLMVQAAAHLARGGSLSMLGRATDTFKKMQVVRPKILPEGSGILGSVVYVDNFGNLITNITQKTFEEVGYNRQFEIQLPRNRSLNSLHKSYFGVSAGNIVALFNSQNLLEIALTGARGKDFNGANTMLGMQVRDNVSIYFS